MIRHTAAGRHSRRILRRQNYRRRAQADRTDEDCEEGQSMTHHRRAPVTTLILRQPEINGDNNEENNTTYIAG